MKSIRFQVVLAAAFATAGAMCFAAQTGKATYQAKCQKCHGPEGQPNPGIARILGVKPANDPSVMKLSVAEMEAVVKNGKGRMKPIHGLTNTQVKDVVMYFRELGKKK